MKIIKKFRRWLRDPRRTIRRKSVNQRSTVPLVAAQTVTDTCSVKQDQQSAEKPLTERDDIARRMKEMVNRSTELRNAKNLRSPQNVGVYQERVTDRMARIPAKNPRSNFRNH